MRRVFMFGIGVLIAVVLFSGCSSHAIKYSDKYVSGQDSEYWYYASPSLECPMADTEDGYYYMNGPANQFLYYMDKTTGEAATVCSKPECMHNDITCNAYLTEYYIKALVFYFDKIYYISKDYVNDLGNWKEVLYELSPDGTRKQLLVFSEAVYHLVVHRGHIYYIATDNGTVSGKENETQTIIRFYKLPIQKINSEPELLYEFEGIYARAGTLLCYGNNIYFSQILYQDASMTKLNIEVERYNILDETIDSILENCGRYTIFNDQLAFVDMEGTYISDLDGQNIHKIWDQAGILLPANDYLLIDTIRSSNVINGKDTRYIIAIDKKEDFVGSVDLKDFTDDPIGVVDNQFLLSDFNTDTQGTTIYSIPVDKIADGTGQPELFFEYTGELLWR